MRKKRIISAFLAVAVGLMSCLPTGAFAIEQTRGGDIAVDAAAFPDANFRSWILDKNHLGGAGADGWLTREELAQIKEIDVSGRNIASLEGIGYFSALESLTCTANSLTELDTSGNPQLRGLYCSNNLLTALDLSRNPALESLYCASNRIETLKISACSELKNLNCERNRLTELDLSGNPALEWLYCRHNQLSQLDVKNNTELVFIETFDNQLTSFDPSPLKKLTFLHIDYNQLKTLDMSHNPNLQGNGFVAANNQLDELVLPDIPDFEMEAAVFYEQNPRQGYDRVEWYWDPQYTREIQEEEILKAEGQTVYAKWIPNPYTVVYRPNGGQGEMQPQAVSYDQTFTLSPNQFERTGYTFQSWNTYSSGVGGREYGDGQEVKNLAGSNSSRDQVILYAQWKPVNYTICYHANGGEGNMAETSALYDQALALAPNEFTKQDAVFVGWSLQEDASSRDFFPGQQVKNLAAREGAQVDLYAVWVTYQEIQQVYQDQLEEFYNQYSHENYYNEDWMKLEEACQTAREEIEGAGQDEAVMQQALETAISAIQAVPTKEERAGEAAEGWKSAHLSLLNQLGAVIPMEELDSRKTANEAALADAQPRQLETYSTLQDEASRQQAAEAARELLKEEIGGLEEMAQAIAWLESARDWQERPLGQVQAEDEGLYAQLEESLARLPDLSREYCDPQVTGRITVRRQFARKKAEALTQLQAAFDALVQEDYTPENQQVLQKILEDNKRRIQEADVVGMPDQLLAQAKEQLNGVDPILKAPVILEKPAASPLTPGQRLEESRLTGGRADVEGSFAWKDGGIAPQTTGEYTVVFTPKDTRRYQSVELGVTVTVNQPTSTPEATPTPTPSLTPTPKPEGGSGQDHDSDPAPTPTAQPTATPQSTPTPTRPAGTAGTRPGTGTPTPTPFPAGKEGDAWTVTLETKAELSEGRGSASVSAADLERAAEQAIRQAAEEKAAPALCVSVPKYEGRAITVSLPVRSLKALAGQDGAKLLIKARPGQAELDAKLLAALPQEGDLALGLEYIPAEQLSQAQKEAAGGLPVYELTLTVNGSPLADWAGGQVRMTIPFTGGSSSAQPGTWMLGSEGEKTRLTGTWDQEARTLSFETQQAARFLVGQQEQEAEPTPEAEPETPEPEKKAGIGLPAILGGAAAILILAGLLFFLKNKARHREE